MGRKSIKESRRKEIVQVFYQVARKEGLENTSIARIAKELDINPSLIIHYFQNREDLTYGLIEFILDKYQLIFKVSSAAKNHPRKALEEIMDNLFSKKWNSLFDDGLFYSCYALAFRDMGVRGMYKELLDSLRNTLAAHIQKYIEEENIGHLDAVRTADTIFVLVDGAYFYLSMVRNKDEYLERLDTYKSQALSMLSLN